MLKDRENHSSNGVNGGQTSQSKLTQLVSEEHQANPYEGIDFRRNSNKGFDSKPSKLGISQELTLSYLFDNSKLGPGPSDNVKGKLVVSEDHNDQNQEENRWVERDFLQLSENSSKREVEDDEIYGINRDKRPKLETLDLSLALPDSSNSNNTQTTFSNDFTTGSMSYSYSNQFSHNPSCSLTRNSTENYEYSMGSHRRDCGEGTNGSVHSRFRPVGDGNVALVQSNCTNSDNNLSLFPSQLPARMKMDAQLCSSGSRPERILQEIVSESVPTMAQVIQELPDETIESIKDYLKKLILIPEKQDELVRLQLRLERRSDLTHEFLSKANKNQVLILVSVKTGLDSFLLIQTHLPANELIEIFLFERCKNVNCKRLLPVEDCHCKICSKKKGFCSECMCPVCLNFDCANNTCSWIGCDMCSHWCHAACSIQKNLIRPGPSLKGPRGTTEMQFNCMCCGHSSEMFGFIKDVFKSCAEEWGLETLIKELDCVRKIFKGSEDFKGKKLQLKASEMISKLENKVMAPLDVFNFILEFFNCIDTDDTSNFPVSNYPSTDIIPPSKPQSVHTSFYKANTSHENTLKATTHTMNTNNIMINDEWSVKSSKKDGFDSMESLVRIKEAESRMFQKKADEARRESEGYKRMIRKNIEKLNEEYKERIEKLNLNEIEERRTKKEEEVKVSENDCFEYYKMKMRMQAEIAGLLERMEKTKQKSVLNC